MENLQKIPIEPITNSSQPLTSSEVQVYKAQLPEWVVVEENSEKRLQRTYQFKNFLEALKFTNQVGNLAEAENHHPALITEWGKVTVTWWTHKIGGLHRNDFVMAARTEDLYSKS
ncbi:MAG: 4a-hydroxytetrahydrobiopterin dehydratase [Anaerolineaceae bacterium]|nr:4a-hydroxytetrahydrobiopterin dehydratase [Anaerolineaceae bacterium]